MNPEEYTEWLSTQKWSDDHTRPYHQDRCLIIQKFEHVMVGQDTMAKQPNNIKTNDLDDFVDNKNIDDGDYDHVIEESRSAMKNMTPQELAFSKFFACSFALKLAKNELRNQQSSGQSLSSASASASASAPAPAPTPTSNKTKQSSKKTRTAKKSASAASTSAAAPAKISTPVSSSTVPDVSKSDAPLSKRRRRRHRQAEKRASGRLVSNQVKTLQSSSNLNSQKETTYDDLYSGNSVLVCVNQKKHEYIFIGSKILSFVAKSPIHVFHSRIGGNYVSYPYAYDKDGNYYLFNNRTMLLKTDGWKWTSSPYMRMWTNKELPIDDQRIITPIDIVWSQSPPRRKMC
jgi:hypothetical protein